MRPRWLSDGQHGVDSFKSIGYGLSSDNDPDRPHNTIRSYTMRLVPGPRGCTGLGLGLLDRVHIMDKMLHFERT